MTHDARITPDETIDDASRIRWSRVRRMTARNLGAMIIVTIVARAALAFAHAFDDRVPVLAPGALGVLAFGVITSATWMRWAILANDDDRR